MNSHDVRAIASGVSAVFGQPGEMSWQQIVAELALMLAMDVGLERKFLGLIATEREALHTESESDLYGEFCNSLETS